VASGKWQVGSGGWGVVSSGGARVIGARVLSRRALAAATPGLPRLRRLHTARLRPQAALGRPLVHRARTAAAARAGCDRATPGRSPWRERHMPDTGPRERRGRPGATQPLLPQALAPRAAASCRPAAQGWHAACFVLPAITSPSHTPIGRGESDRPLSRLRSGRPAPAARPRQDSPPNPRPASPGTGPFLCALGPPATWARRRPATCSRVASWGARTLMPILPRGMPPVPPVRAGSWDVTPRKTAAPPP